MSKPMSLPRVFPAVAWLMTGVMLSGTLLNTLSVADNSTVCVEERVLESDDDRSDSRELDLALLNPFDECTAPPTWHIAQVFFCDHISTIRAAAHLQRGPPLN